MTKKDEAIIEPSLLGDGEIQLVLTGKSEADPAKGWLPAWYFAICAPDGTRMGACVLRVGRNENTYYGGSIGYTVEPPYRGRHYAGKACRLLFGLARRQGMEELVITCNPDNRASRRTCEWLGGELVEIAELPEDNDMRLEDGETHKCIYRFDLRRRSV